jgi:hypothetical protein
MNPFGQTPLRKFFESPRECGFRRQLPAERKAANPPFLLPSPQKKSSHISSFARGSVRKRSLFRPSDKGRGKGLWGWRGEFAEIEPLLRSVRRRTKPTTVDLYEVLVFFLSLLIAPRTDRFVYNRKQLVYTKSIS